MSDDNNNNDSECDLPEIPQQKLKAFNDFEEENIKKRNEIVDEYNVKAVINYKGLSVSGIFTFNQNFEMISFTTNDRAVVGTDGSTEYVKWSAVCEDYKIADNGIKYPSKFKAIWNYPDKDFVYFDGNIDNISYDY